MVMKIPQDLVSVVFTEHWDKYNAGEIAGFPKWRAKLLIKMGVANLRDSSVEKEVARAEAPKDDHPAAARAKRPRR